mgnify:CR=1 FL=1
MSFSDLDSFEIEDQVVPDEAPWEPQAGSQTDVLETREYVDELFIGGGRGTGKTDTLLGDYAMDVPKYGRHWRGIIFRRTLSQFREIIDRSKEIYTKRPARRGTSLTEPSSIFSIWRKTPMPTSTWESNTSGWDGTSFLTGLRQRLIVSLKPVVALR